jgi:hypothetical protein
MAVLCANQRHTKPRAFSRPSQTRGTTKAARNRSRGRVPQFANLPTLVVDDRRCLQRDQGADLLSRLCLARVEPGRVREVL